MIREAVVRKTFSWLWIENRDSPSKRLFFSLVLLLTLVETGGKGGAPSWRSPPGDRGIHSGTLTAEAQRARRGRSSGGLAESRRMSEPAALPLIGFDRTAGNEQNHFPK